MTYRFSESRQLFCLFPAKDVESIGKREKEEDIRYDKRGQNVQLALNFIHDRDVGCTGLCDKMVTPPMIDNG